MVAAFAAAAILIGACGSDSDTDATAPNETAPTTAADATTTTLANTTPTTTEAAPAELRVITPQADTTGLESRTFPLLGGLRLAYEADIVTYAAGDFVGLRRGGATAIVARVSIDSGGAWIDNAADFLERFEATYDVDVAPAGERIELMGHELTRYTATTDPDTEPLRAFPVAPRGYTGNYRWDLVPYADFYVGDTVEGAFVVAATGADESELEDAIAIREALLPTLEFTTDNGTASARGTRPIQFAAIGDEVTPIEPDPDGPTALVDIFAPVEPGTYQLPNLGIDLTVDVSQDWEVHPNFPGLVVLVDPPILGPSDHDLVFMTDVKGFSPAGAGGSDAGPGVLLNPINAFLENPPPGLEISNRVDTTIGGQPAVQFDVEISADATCQVGDPCVYFVTGPVTHFVKHVRPGFTHRMWIVDTPTHGSLLIAASVATADADWIDERATPLVDSITIG